MAATVSGAPPLLVDPSLILDHLPVQIWQLSDEHTYGPANAVHAAFLGRRKEELDGLRLEQIFIPEVAEACRISNLNVLSSATPITVEEWVPDCRGVSRLLSITKTRIPAADGGPDGILCVGLDVTEQRAAERLLAQSEANFRTLIETIDDLVVIGDPDGRLRYVNPATRVKLGYTNEEILGLNLLDLHPSWVQQETKSIISEMFAGRRLSCPLPLVSKHGTLLPVETRLWFGKWDGQDCVFGLSLDLSREQESLQKFEKLFRRNPALMAITDVETRRFVDVNDTFLRAMGYTADEVLGKTPGELNMFPGKDEQARVADLLETYGKLEELELFARTRDGSVLTGLFSGELIESQGKTFFLTVMLDISERKRAAEERELIIAELKGALAQIKTLRGIFPICAKCKKIRDDKGYWQQVEAYISQRTDAHFSHGLCPHCMELLYPEFLEDPPLPDKS